MLSLDRHLTRRHPQHSLAVLIESIASFCSVIFDIKRSAETTSAFQGLHEDLAGCDSCFGVHQLHAPEKPNKSFLLLAGDFEQAKLRWPG
jgi:hypothetical protein